MTGKRLSKWTDEERRAMACDGRQALAAAFPQVFPAHGSKRPVKLGIQHDIGRALPDMSRGTLGYALADFCEGPDYLRAIVEGAPRIGLDGEPNGFVTAAEAVRAKRRLGELEEMWCRRERRHETIAATAQVEAQAEEGA